MATSLFYFNAYDSGGEEWASNPGNMVNLFTTQYASTLLDNDVELLTGNDCDGSDYGVISKVELGCYGYGSSGDKTVNIRPVFSGSDDGDNHQITLPNAVGNADWSAYQDITSDTNAPGTWGWTDVQNLDCDIEAIAVNPQSAFISRVRIQVTYTPTPLVADDITTGAPVLDSPVFGNIGVLTATDITTGIPVLDSPVYGNIGVCTPVDIATGAPVLDSPVLLHKHVLVASNIITGNPVLEAPILYSKAINWSMLDPYTDSPGDDLASVSDSAGDILAASNTIGSDLTVYDDSP